MKLFVLDNSIAMRWAFDGAAHPQAEAVLQDLESFAREAWVPVLWRYEAAAVLAVAHNRGTLPAQEITLFFSDLEVLPIRVDHESSSRVFSDVYRLAVAHRLTVYDAAYLELAIRRKLPLATLDNDLIAACGTVGVALL